MSREIAIIGMAVRLPGAENQRVFLRNLRNGTDCVTEISEQRFCDSNFPFRDERLQVMGLLDQVDRFDRKFFGISPREAQQMDPHQRLTLEVAYETIEDSGYNPASLNGADVTVVVADADYEYKNRVPDPEPSMYSGNAQFSIAGRVARFLNTNGPAFIVDTGCSSALMGVTLACDQLALGQASLGLVVGARIVLDTLPVNLEVDYDLGITSGDGKTRSFNANSNGSGSSEAVVGVLLKPLAQARRDRDHVYATIKACAVNASAQSSASLTATSSSAQAALLELAWRRAGFDPRTIGYIEAHGSGTKLGDPIEINGIDTAFRQFTDRRHFCAVSSVKSNIGHTDKVAGLSGLAKAVLALKYGEHFPALHFDQPNPLIDFANSATYINTEHKPWPRVDDAPRRAGVSSFGFAGNNVHVVLEEYVEEAGAHPEMAPADCYLVTASSKRPDGVAANLAALCEHLETEPATALADVSFTLNTGREHFRHRTAFVARDLADLIEQIRSAPARNGHDEPVPEETETIVLFTEEAAPEAGIVTSLADRHPAFAEAYADCRSALGGRPEGEAFRCFAWQYSLYRLLEQCGVALENVVGLGLGDLVAQAVLGEATLAEAVADLPDRLVVADDLEARLPRLFDLATDGKCTIFVELGAGGVAEVLTRLKAGRGDVPGAVLALDPATRDGFLDLLRRLYLAGARVDWAAYHRRDAGGRRVSLPGYQFERIRCWYCPPHQKSEYDAWRRRTAALGQGETPALRYPAGAITAPSATPRELSVDATWTPTEQKVARIWMEVLRLDEVGLDDDFFSLGGHSLFGTMVRNRIERGFGLTLEFKDIFAQSRIRTLAENLDRRLAAGEGHAILAGIPTVAPAEHYAVSPAQFRLWLLDQKEGAMLGAYNVTIVLRLRGRLEADRLAEALHALVARHESLRTHFIEVDGEPRQVVNATVDFKVERQTTVEDGLLAVIDEFIQPFDLGRAPLVRAAIVRLGETSHALLLDLHHTLFDGSSYSVLLRDLGALYRGEPLPPVTVTYKDYAAWRAATLDDAAMREAEAYWLNLFREKPAALELPADFPRPAVRSFEGAVRDVQLEAAAFARLRALAQAENATLFMTLLTAYSALLAKYSGQGDIVVGSTVAGRTHADVEPIVGLFVNTVAFRTAPRDERTFREFLREVREHCFQTYRYQDYPFESLIQKLDLAPDRSRNPLFDTLLVLQNIDLGTNGLDDDLAIEPGEFVRRSAKFDLTLEFYEGTDGLHLNLEYCAALFRPETVDRIGRDLIALLATVGETPDVRLGDLAVAGAGQPAEADGGDFNFAGI